MNMNTNMNPQQISMIKTTDHITISFPDGYVATVYSSDTRFEKLCRAVKSKDYGLARDIADITFNTKKELNRTHISDVTIKDGHVLYNGEVIHNTLTKRMIDMVNDGYDVDYLLNFLDNLFDNTSHVAINELYLFLEESELPITPDGHFLAYKRIRSNWTDCHTGKISNHIGEIVEMSRRDVDDQRNHTCSAGLHFCSKGYLPHYGAHDNTRVVVVKINPRDVVSIPSDYNNAKGRCCRYEVIRELDIDDNFLPSNIEGLVSGSAADQQSPDDADVLIQMKMDGTVVAEYASVVDASDATNIPPAYIKRVLSGSRISTGGFKWEWNKHPQLIDKDDEYAYEQDEEYEANYI